MAEDALVTLIRDVGVPAAILMVVLLRIEPKLDTLIEAVRELTAALYSGPSVRVVRNAIPRKDGE